jgi:hypothetical protein
MEATVQFDRFARHRRDSGDAAAAIEHADAHLVPLRDPEHVPEVLRTGTREADTA